MEIQKLKGGMQSTPAWLTPREFRPAEASGSAYGGDASAHTIDVHAFWGGPSYLKRKQKDETAEKLAKLVVGRWLQKKVGAALKNAFAIWSYQAAHATATFKGCEVLVRLSSRHEQTRSWQAFMAFQMAVQSSMKKLSNSLENRSFAMRGTAVLKWRLFVEQEKSRELVKAYLSQHFLKIGERHTRYKIARYFSQWRDVACELTRGRSLLTRTCTGWFQRSKRRAFCAFTQILNAEKSKTLSCDRIGRLLQKWQERTVSGAFSLWQTSFLRFGLKEARGLAERALTSASQAQQQAEINMLKRAELVEENSKLNLKIEELELKIQTLLAQLEEHVKDTTASCMVVAGFKLASLLASRKGISILWGDTNCDKKLPTVMSYFFGGKLGASFVHWVMVSRILRWVETIHYGPLAMKVAMTSQVVEKMQKAVVDAKEETKERIWTCELLGKKLVVEQDIRKKLQKECKDLQRQLSKLQASESQLQNECLQLKATIEGYKEQLTESPPERYEAVSPEGMNAEVASINDTQYSPASRHDSQFSMASNTGRLNQSKLAPAGLFSSSQFSETSAFKSGSESAAQRKPSENSSSGSTRINSKGDVMATRGFGAEAMIYRTLERVFVRYSQPSMVDDVPNQKIRYMTLNSWVSLLSDAQLQFDKAQMEAALYEVIGEKNSYDDKDIQQALDIGQFTVGLQALAKMFFPAESSEFALRQLLLNHVLLLAQGKCTEFTEQWQGASKAPPPAATFQRKEKEQDTFVSQLEGEILAVEQLVSNDKFSPSHVESLIASSQLLPPSGTSCGLSDFSLSTSNFNTPPSSGAYSERSAQRLNATSLSMLDSSLAISQCKSAGPVIGRISGRPVSSSTPKFPLKEPTTVHTSVNELLSAFDIPQVQDVFFTYDEVFHSIFDRYAVHRTQSLSSKTPSPESIHSSRKSAQHSETGDAQTVFQEPFYSKDPLLIEDTFFVLAREFGLFPELLSKDFIYRAFNIVTTAFPCSSPPKPAMNFEAFKGFFLYASMGLYWKNQTWTYRTKLCFLLCQLKVSGLDIYFAAPIYIRHDVEEFLWSMFEYYGSGESQMEVDPFKGVQITGLDFLRFVSDFSLVDKSVLSSSEIETLIFDVARKHARPQRLQGSNSHLGAHAHPPDPDLHKRTSTELFFVDFCCTLIEMSKIIHVEQRHQSDVFLLDLMVQQLSASNK